MCPTRSRTSTAHWYKMEVSQAIQNLAIRAGAENKSLRTLINGNLSSLSGLTTTQKANLVAAINDVQAQVNAIAAGGGAPINDDTIAPSSVWSSSKVSQEVSANAAADRNRANHTGTQAIASVSGLQNALDAQTTALGFRVRADAAQSFDATQRAQARSNIGAISSADAVSPADVGDTEQDFVATFDAALL